MKKIQLYWMLSSIISTILFTVLFFAISNVLFKLSLPPYDENLPVYVVGEAWKNIAIQPDCFELYGISKILLPLAISLLIASTVSLLLASSNKKEAVLVTLVASTLPFITICGFGGSSY